MIYFSMLRDENTLIYYNKIRQCVQQDVKGYFFNQTAIDKKLEKEILSERISNSDKKDSILPKVHYLIPRLELRTFLLLFDFYAVKYFDPVQDFLTAFKKLILAC